MVLNPRQEFEKKYTHFETPLTEGEEQMLDYFQDRVKSEKVDMNDFIDVYGELEIQRDKNELKRAKTSYGDAYRHERAVLGEYMLFDQIEQSNWLGDEVGSFLTSEFDDVKNGIDMVLEFPGSDEGINYLAVDVTTSPEATIDKVEHIRENILESKLPRVKYFESVVDDTKGRINNLPEVVLGMDREFLDKVARLYADKFKRGSVQREEIYFGDLRKQLFEMIILQLQKILDEFKDKEDSEWYKNYKEALGYFKEKYETMEFEDVEERHFKNEVYESLKKYLKTPKE